MRERRRVAHVGRGAHFVHNITCGVSSTLPLPCTLYYTYIHIRTYIYEESGHLYIDFLLLSSNALATPQARSLSSQSVLSAFTPFRPFVLRDSSTVRHRPRTLYSWRRPARR